jgi:hypothetical protein
MVAVMNREKNRLGDVEVALDLLGGRLFEWFPLFYDALDSCIGRESLVDMVLEPCEQSADLFSRV